MPVIAAVVLGGALHLAGVANWDVAIVLVVAALAHFAAREAFK